MANGSRPEITELVSWRLCAAATVGMLAVGLAAAFLSPDAQRIIAGILLSLILGLAWDALCRLRFRPSQLTFLEWPFHLAHDRELFDRYREISEALLAISQQRDRIYRGVAIDKLSEITGQVGQIAGGTLAFEGTETWRIVYEKLLASPGLQLYRSVSWVKNRYYWQDEPGRKSMAVNATLHASRRLTIERIVIVADELWPQGEPFPDERVHLWIREQHQQGLWIKLLRQSVLANEPELVADIGIYGSRALGIQELDENCQTVRFILTFDFDAVLAAEARWQKLDVYAIAYGELLDQIELPL